MSRGPTTHRLGVFPVGKRTYASGLFWQPVRLGKGARQDAQAFAFEHGYQHVAYHFTDGLAQAGLVPVGGPKASGIYSAAAVLTTALGSSWLAAFQLDDGRMILAAAYDGAIVPGSDRIGSEQQIREAFDAVNATIRAADGEWGLIIAPSGWEEGAVPAPLSEILASAKLKSTQRVRQVKFRLTMTQIAGAVGAVLAITAGGVTAQSYIERAREEQRLARIERAQAAQAAEQQAELNRIIAEGPWSTIPPAKAMLELCAAGWAHVPLSIEGWLFEQGRCSVNQLSAQYRRSGSATVGTFTAAVAPHFGEPRILESGEVASIMFSTDMPLADEGTLPPINQQLTSLISHTQAFGLPVSVNDVRKGGVDSDTPEDNRVASWHAHAFHLATQLPPDQIFRDLDIAGLRINHIDISLDSSRSELTWTVSGDIYGK